MDRLRVVGYDNLYVYTFRKDYYYWREMIDYHQYEKCTKVKAEYKLVVINGHNYANPTKNIRLASEVAEKFHNEVIKTGMIEKTIYFSRLFDDALEIKKNKAKRTYIIATDSDKHVRPFFGETPLKYFDNHYRTLWAKYVATEKAKSNRMLQHDVKWFIYCLRIAYQKGWVKRLYSRKDFEIPDKSKRIGVYIDDKDLAAIMEQIKLIGDDKFMCHFQMALRMGMRRSEILGLRLDEIDPVKREFYLDAKRLKTRISRPIPIPVPEIVWQHFEPFYKKAVAMGGKYVFPMDLNTRGGVARNEWTDDNFTWDSCQKELPKYWDSMRKKLGLKIRFHDLRHTCISNMIVKGIPLPTISQFVGADMKILNEVYAHHNDESKEMFRNALKGRY